jgi:hypothetical protein
MPTPQHEAVRITGPGELIAAIPSLLGFHPDTSLVLVGLHDRQLLVTARMDLAETARALPCLRDALHAIAHSGASDVIAAVFDDPSLACSPDFGVDGGLERLHHETQCEGLELIDVLVVHRTRWRSALCRDETCCPFEGTALPAAPTSAQAAAIYVGTADAPNRRALTERFTPGPARERLRPLLSAADRELAEQVCAGPR